MLPHWRLTLQQHFYYIREVFLGVLIRSQKNAGETVRVVKSSQEQVLFSSQELKRTQVRAVLRGQPSVAAEKPRTAQASGEMEKKSAIEASTTLVAAALPATTTSITKTLAEKQTQSQNQQLVTERQDLQVETVPSRSTPSQLEYPKTNVHPTETRQVSQFSNEPQSTAKAVTVSEKAQPVTSASPPSAIPHHTKRTSGRPWYKNLGTVVSLLLIIGGITLGIIYLVPDAYFRLFPADVISFGSRQQETDAQTPTDIPATPTPTPYIPPIDPSLPQGEWLIIPEIGVKTQPKITVNPEDALSTGVWQVPDYGHIGDRDKPVILAAHRYGWKWWWQSDYWKYNSFYNLPNTKPGTRVELIKDQRKWIYEIYAGEEGDAITDYNADLILYTCKFLNSPIRHVRYARIVDPNQPITTATPAAQLTLPAREGAQSPLGEFIPYP